MERIIGLGWTAEGHRVTAEIRLEPLDPGCTATFTDHSMGPRPATVGISFTVQDMRRPSSGYYNGGQVPAEDRVITRRHENDASPEVAAFIEEAWEHHHLNTMNAACDHMTVEVLAHQEGETTSDWQKRMLDETVCPVTGYRWGRAWLAKSIPADVFKKLEHLVTTGAIAWPNGRPTVGQSA